VHEDCKYRYYLRTVSPEITEESHKKLHTLATFFLPQSVDKLGGIDFTSLVTT